MHDETITTAEDLLVRQPPDLRSELVNGRMLVREPGAYRHGLIALHVGSALRAFVVPRQLGDVVAAETGFTLRRNPDTVRAADAAFIHADRAPVDPGHGFIEMAPDLAVEVLSPSDRSGDIQARVADWLAAGTQLVWVIDPERRHATVYRPKGDAQRILEDGALDGEQVVPGFRLSLPELLSATHHHG